MEMGDHTGWLKITGPLNLQNYNQLLAYANNIAVCV